MWWGVLSSSSGAVFGNEAVWSFPSRWGFWRPWQRSLASPGTTDFRCLGALLDAIRRQDLVPSGLSGTNRLVVSSQGEPFAADAYVAAAASEDGETLLVYVPPTGGLKVTFTLDLERAPGALTARWYNPVTGAIPTTELVQGGAIRTFTSPGNNGTGQNDWVLVLSADSKLHPWATPKGCTGEVASSAAMRGVLPWVGAGVALALAAAAAVYLWNRRPTRPPTG